MVQWRTIPKNARRRVTVAALAAVVVGGCAPATSGASGFAGCMAADDRCLAVALHDGDVAGFARLLDARPYRGDANAEGDTLVHLAAADRNPGFLDALLRRGVDPNTPNAVTARTPLMSALMAEREPQIERLLAAGVDLSRTDRTGNTALHVAAQINDPGKVLRLLKAGAPADALNAQRQTFRRYLYMTPVALLDRRAAGDLAQVTAWLSARAQLEDPAVDRQ